MWGLEFRVQSLDWTTAWGSELHAHTFVSLVFSLRALPVGFQS